MNIEQYINDVILNYTYVPEDEKELILYTFRELLVLCNYKWLIRLVNLVALGYKYEAKIKEKNNGV